MTTGEFESLVSEMRKAQKAYCQSRSSRALEKAHEFERSVDDVLARREARLQRMQGNLFAEGRKNENKDGMVFF